jgi:hypothetical protein
MLFSWFVWDETVALDHEAVRSEGKERSKTGKKSMCSGKETGRQWDENRNE